MIAATRSRMECSASDRIPRLPVATARNTFRQTSTTAENTEPRAAMRFSRDACETTSDILADYTRAGKAHEADG